MGGPAATGAGTRHGRIYVFGGNDPGMERSAEAWDPQTGKSTDLPKMPVARGFPGVAVTGERKGALK